MRHTPAMLELCIAQNKAADELLSRDPLALLVGMMLDQHVRQRSSGDPAVIGPSTPLPGPAGAHAVEGRSASAIAEGR